VVVRLLQGKSGVGSMALGNCVFSVLGSGKKDPANIIDVEGVDDRTPIVVLLGMTWTL